jgi:nucleoside-diphosphate-sugar epimerase
MRQTRPYPKDISPASPLHVLVLGYGYSAQYISDILKSYHAEIVATTRSPDKAESMRESGLIPCIFTGDETLEHAVPAGFWQRLTHVLVSIPPQGAQEPAFGLHADILRNAPQLKWIGYLSTTGVYGDHDGAWVTEDTPCAPRQARSQRRLGAEQIWLQSGLPVYIFRLAGIYGPGRSAVEQLKKGVARRIDKPGHKFGRIHVEDIANIVTRSMFLVANGQGHDRILNVVDDAPAEPREVIEYVCAALSLPMPPLQTLAAAQMSDMALSFWQDNRLVSNQKLHALFESPLRYPTYKEGLSQIMAADAQEIIK